ncbi:GWxTD domain-containing protein, partial [bacterium]|nr:GWxTD domain-containing protein [bacterium]
RAILPRIGGAFLIVLLTVANSFPHAIPDQPEHFTQNYYFDFLTFRCADPNRTFLEIFCQVPLSNLTSAGIVEDAQAHYDINITLFNRETWHTNVLSYTDSVFIESKNTDRPSASTELLRFTFLAAPGDYLATVKVANRDRQTYFSFDHEIEIPDYHYDELQISDLQIATAIQQTDKTSVLVKNGRKIMPNVSHIVGPSQRFLFVYAEVYNLIQKNTESNQFEATFSIVDRDGRSLKSIPYKIAKPGSASAVSVSIPIGDLPSGNYRVILDIEDLDNAELASNFANIIVVKADAFYSSEQFTEAVRELGFAGGSDAKKWRKHTGDAHTNGIQRWQRGEDLGLISDQNHEANSEHTQRLDYANRHFINSNGEGWESDQGKVYLKNGPPTSIDRISSGGDQVYEVWEYSDIDRSYLFIDEWGKGHFRLLKTSTSVNLPFQSKSEK